MKESEEGGSKQAVEVTEATSEVEEGKMPRKSKAESTPEGASVESMQSMFEAMISLLGRLAFPPEQLRAIIMKRKRNPEDYVKAYNLCDEEHTLSQIADAINVSAGTLSPILSEWKELGIVYEITKKGGKFYKKLYKLEMPKPSEIPKEEKVNSRKGREKNDGTKAV